MPKTGILILAAGASVRMGQPKQLLPWKNSTLLGNAIEVAKSISEDILVVLGANSKKIESEMMSTTNRVLNPDWESGMGVSIAIGVDRIEKLPGLEYILILLVDQPLIDTIYLQELLGQADIHPNKIIATSYGEKGGVPALFPKSYFNELKLLSKDYGAKHMMASNSYKTILVDSKGKAVDLDTPDNYQVFWKKHGL